MKKINALMLCIVFMPLFISAVSALDIANDTMHETITIVRNEVATLCDFTANFAFAHWALLVYSQYGLSFKNIYNEMQLSAQKERFLQYMAFVCVAKCAAYLIKPKSYIYKKRIS